VTFLKWNGHSMQ